MAMYCTNCTCRHKFIMSYFNEDIQECEEHCDICTLNVDTIQDCTSIALLIIQGLERLQQVQEKVTVLLLTQFLMESPTIVLKALALDKAAEFGLVKDYFKTKTGRRDLQALIYHLIITGMISEVRTPENPSIVIKTGNVQNGNKYLLVHASVQLAITINIMCTIYVNICFRFIKIAEVAYLFLFVECCTSKPKVSHVQFPPQSSNTT